MEIKQIIKLSILGLLAYGAWSLFYIPKETIYKKDFKDKWAFKADMVMLECFQDSTGKMPVVIVKGKPYGLTGYADNRYGQKDLEKINDIWLLNPDDNTSHVDIGIFQKKAEKLCE